MQPFGTAIEAASQYLRGGLCPVPIETGQKAPRRPGWQNVVPSLDDLPSYFNGHGNVGIITGSPSGHVHDVDLDCDEAVFLAPLLLPETEMISGREMRPSSHYWYRSEGLEYRKFNDPIASGSRACVVEVRGGEGHQTVVAPSIHPDGDRYEWISLGPPADVEAQRAMRFVSELAACCLLARYYPPHGTRHEAVLALAGYLARGGMKPEFVADFIRSAAACHDTVNPSDVPAATPDALGDIEGAVRDTVKKLKAGAKATGFTRAAEFWDKRVLDRVGEWLGIRRGPDAPELPAMTPLATTVTGSAIEWTDMPAPEPFPMPVLDRTALHGFAGRYVDAISPHTEADPLGVLTCFLAAFSVTANRFAHFRVGGAYHYANLFVTLVGDTAAGRKGTATSEALRLFVIAGKEFEPPRASGLSSGEGFLYAIRDPTIKVTKTKDAAGIEREEPEVVDPGVPDKALLVVEEELASVLQRMKREGNTVSALLRQAWDSAPMSVLTKSALHCHKPHVGMIAHITGRELGSLLNSVDRSNGFANRMIFAAVHRPHILPLAGRGATDDDLYPLAVELRGAIRFARERGEMFRTPAADELWCDIYEKLTLGGDTEITDITARGAQHVMRLAMNYALLDRSPMIDVDHLAAALSLWGTSEASVGAIFRGAPGLASTVETGSETADEAIRELRDRGGWMTKDDFVKHFPRHTSPGQLRSALAYLVQEGLARSQKARINGKAVERWMAVKEKEEP